MDPSDDIPTSAADEPAGPIDDLPIGSRVGPYVIVGALGRGGMGQVLLGDDTRLHRKVALKRLLASSGAGENDRSRVLREARAAAQVSHPNVATIHDIIQHGLHAFIVMEYVEGKSLAELLRRERLPLHRVVTIGKQLAAALAAAHAKGVIHRDLKPANIQLTPDGVVKILDFGVAGTTTSFVTTTGATALERLREGQPGTRGYMAPEQLLGGYADERSDVFSLGVVLFEMATGERAYVWIDELDLTAALSRPVRRADAVDPRVPSGLADVIAKALAVDPANRFQSVVALGSALEPFDQSAKAAGSPLRRVASGLGLGVPAVLLSALLFGLLTSTAFNLTTGRNAGFGDDAPIVWLELGLRSFVTPAFYITAMVVLMWAARFAVRLLRLIGPFDRFARAVRMRGLRIIAQLGLDDPVEFGQAVAAAGILALIVVVWSFADLLAACLTTINDGPAERLAILQPGRHPGALYRFVLDVLLVAFAAAILKIRRLRRNAPGTPSRSALAPIVALLAVTVVLSETPYRLLWQNDAERIDYAGDRCYILGAKGADGLIYCPDRTPPRTRIVALNDAAVRRLRLPRESIFTPPEARR